MTPTNLQREKIHRKDCDMLSNVGIPSAQKNESYCTCVKTPTNPPTEQPRECNCIDCRVGRDLGLKPNYPTDPTVDSIGEFIRDVTQVIPRPKSEVRRRLNAILSHSVQEAKAEERSRMADIIESHRDNIHDDISDLLASLKQEDV